MAPGKRTYVFGLHVDCLGSVGAFSLVLEGPLVCLQQKVDGAGDPKAL